MRQTRVLWLRCARALFGPKLFGVPPQFGSMRSMHPWMFFGNLSLAAVVYCGKTLNQMIEEVRMMSRWKGKKKGRIDSVVYRGLGWWQIEYSYRIGPKRLYGTQINAGVAACNGPQLQYLFPFGERQSKYTTVGAEVTVLHGKTSTGVRSTKPVLENWMPWEYALVYTVGMIISGRGLYLSLRRFFQLNKLYAIHNTENGLSLLKKSNIHRSAGRPSNKDPVHVYLNSSWPLFAYKPASYGPGKGTAGGFGKSVSGKPWGHPDSFAWMWELHHKVRMDNAAGNFSRKRLQGIVFDEMPDHEMYSRVIDVNKKDAAKAVLKALKAGDTVVVTQGFFPEGGRTDLGSEAWLSIGMKGKCEEFDKSGNALIRFEGAEDPILVSSKMFDYFMPEGQEAQSPRSPANADVSNKLSRKWWWKGLDTVQ